MPYDEQDAKRQSEYRKLEPSIRDWLTSNFIDFDVCGIKPEAIGPKHLICSNSRGVSLYDAYIDGVKPPADWAFSDVCPPSSAILYKAISLFLHPRICAWFTILCHDCAAFELGRVLSASLDPRYLRFVGSYYLQKEPSDQGGPTWAGLISSDYQCLFLFSDEGNYQVAYYGSDQDFALFHKCVEQAHVMACEDPAKLGW